MSATKVIVTWPERGGAVDCRPLRCYGNARRAVARLTQFEHEFAPRRGSAAAHIGPVIVGEIGDVKRSIVFNGDVTNTAARLEELQPQGRWRLPGVARGDGAVPHRRRFQGSWRSGALPIGRADGIDVVGIDEAVATKS